MLENDRQTFPQESLTDMFGKTNKHPIELQVQSED